jgi:hypothetical protein
VATLKLLQEFSDFELFDYMGYGSLSGYRTNRTPRVSALASSGGIWESPCQEICVAAVLPMPSLAPVVWSRKLHTRISSSSSRLSSSGTVLLRMRRVSRALSPLSLRKRSPNRWKASTSTPICSLASFKCGIGTAPCSFMSYAAQGDADFVAPTNASIVPSVSWCSKASIFSLASAARAER